jgi:hypothetical protein
LVAAGRAALLCGKNLLGMARFLLAVLRMARIGYVTEKAERQDRRREAPFSDFSVSDFALPSQLSGDFAAKLFCPVEFWLKRLKKLIGP